MQTKEIVTPDTVKNKIRTYSRFLRRDFLAILVKMSAKHFNIRTVRCDWRTRTGMVAFLQGIWERFAPLLDTDTIFHWYCVNFDSHETLFSNRKFMLYIFANWPKYEQFFKQQETLDFLKMNQNEIEILLSGSKFQQQANWTDPISQQLSTIIEDFFKNKNVTCFVPSNAPKQMPKSMSLPLMHARQAAQAQKLQQQQAPFVAPQPQHAATTDMLVSRFADIQNHQFIQSDDDDSDISTEILFDPINFEIGEYNPDEFPLVNQMDYPDSIDLYSL